MKGGQITISQCSDFSTSGRNFSKNAVVSAGVLYIFQLPAMTGFLIGFACKKLVPCAMLGAEIGGHGLADIGERRAQAEIDARPHLRAGGQQRNVLAAVVGARDGRGRIRGRR